MIDEVDEVRARFDAYEAALVADDNETLREFFWTDATRYGTDGNQYSAEEIDAARRGPRGRYGRTLHRTRIRAVGDGVVVTETEFARDGRLGRQTQVWQRRGHEWRIAHAHVSLHP